MSKAIPIATADDRLADRQKILRYEIVCSGYADELKRVREKVRYVFWEGFVFGLVLGVFLWWV